MLPWFRFNQGWEPPGPQAPSLRSDKGRGYNSCVMWSGLHARIKISDTSWRCVKSLLKDRGQPKAGFRGPLSLASRARRDRKAVEILGGSRVDNFVTRMKIDEGATPVVLLDRRTIMSGGIRRFGSRYGVLRHGCEVLGGRIGHTEARRIKEPDS